MRTLILIVAYNAETTIQWVLSRIPPGMPADTEVLVIDDASRDRTFEVAHDAPATLPYRLTVLANPRNQGYGGNQMVGIRYAIEHGFDVIALVHGDGQYAPEFLPRLVAPIAEGRAEAVFGSRMMTRGGARAGGMPLYKLVGNKVLTAYENLMLGARLSEFHSGYRVYSVAALQRIPFMLNTNDFHFDTEIIIQLLRGGHRIVELPIPTHYGDEVCHVNGPAYAWNVVKASTLARMQRLNLLYDPKYDLAPAPAPAAIVDAKFGFDSSVTAIVAGLAPSDRVLVVGAEADAFAAALAARGWQTAEAMTVGAAEAGLPPLAGYDVVVLFDALQEMADPESMMQRLAEAAGRSPGLKVIASAGNVAFFITRLMLLFGNFNYSKRGILGLRHRRLFTRGTLKRLFRQRGFKPAALTGVPAPYPLAIGDGRLGRGLLALNRALIRLLPTLFSYQLVIVAEPRPGLDWLVENAVSFSDDRRTRTRDTSTSLGEGPGLR